ncbi:MAG: hypothetical protein HKO59_17580 [Phycisphaerales bacterium]|nr:hypothetical protein [Phycisphaerales bacterium]NNM27754.1 hypothetical protein [Phycisphaerales bacterium]
MSLLVLLYFNPIAGAGRSARAAESYAATLRGAGHRVELRPSQAVEAVDVLAADLATPDALLVLGGDGAMRAAAPAAVRADTPVYHLPFGTENLFARHFGMDRSETRLLDALAAMRTTRVDVGRVGEEWFLLMASIGFDAEVIHDLAAHRTGGIRHRSYLGPLGRQLRMYRPSRITTRIDGTTIVDGRPGVLVVANCPEYAVRLDPAPNASMTDRLLDVVFLPAATRRAVIGWMVRCRLGRGEKHVIRGRGTVVDVRLEPAARFQLDGDRPVRKEPVGKVRISLEESTLPVLLP